MKIVSNVDRRKGIVGVRRHIFFHCRDKNRTADTRIANAVRTRKTRSVLGALDFESREAFVRRKRLECR